MSKPTKIEIVEAKLEAERFFNKVCRAVADVATERLWAEGCDGSALDHLVLAFDDTIEQLMAMEASDSVIPNIPNTGSGGNDDEDKGYN